MANSYAIQFSCSDWVKQYNNSVCYDFDVLAEEFDSVITKFSAQQGIINSRSADVIKSVISKTLYAI